jgi:hypothetical protein
MKRIPLTKGKSCIVDDDDFLKFSIFNWYFCKGYAVRKSSGKAIYLHREIMKVGDYDKKFVIDHKNCNSLDNRKENLRVATHRQNQQNKTTEKRSKTGVKGVTLSKLCKNKPFRASIRINGFLKTIGYFSDIVTAGKEYDRFANIFFGKFAKLNRKRC